MKVYGKNCKWLNIRLSLGDWGCKEYYCIHPENSFDDWYQPKSVCLRCSERNKDNNCNWYEPKKK